MSAVMSDTQARLVASLALLPYAGLHCMVLDGRRIYETEGIANRVAEHKAAFLTNADWLAEEAQNYLADENAWVAFANKCDDEFVQRLRGYLEVRAISAAERATAKDLEET